MTRDEIATAVKAYGFTDTDPITTWITEALREFEDASNWPFLQTLSFVSTIAGLDTVALPSDIAKLHTARIVGQTQRLTYCSRAIWEDDVEDPTATGLPTHFTLLGMNMMILYRVPDAVYSIRTFYKKRCADLTSGSTVPNIPVAHHYALVYGAVAIGLATEEDSADQATIARADFGRKIQEARDLYATQQSNEMDQVRDVMEYT